MPRISLVTIVLAVVLIAPTAHAQEVDIVIPIDTVVFEPGVVATQPVPPDLQGATCEVTAIALNNSSVRSGTNLIVSSGADSVALLDVEREEGVVTTATEPLTLGSDVTVSVELGPEMAFSGGITVTITCEPVASPSPSGPSPTPSPSPPDSPSPTPTVSSTTTPSPSETTTASTPPSDTPSETVTPSVLPTTVTSGGDGSGPRTPPSGLAFTGARNVVPLAIVATVLLLAGTALLRLGHAVSRRKG